MKKRFHEYSRRLDLVMDQIATTGKTSHSVVVHDNDCGVFRGKWCQCDPDIMVYTDVGNFNVTKDGHLEPVH